jgi:hypothetical protein
MEKEPARLRFRIRPVDAYRLDISVAQTALKTKSDVVREAITLFSYIWEAQRQPGNRVVLRNDEERRQYELSISLSEPSPASQEGDIPEAEEPSILEVRLPPDRHQLLESLLKEGVARNRSALVRDAIALYQHVVSRLAKGWYLAVMDRESRKILFTLPVPGMIQEESATRSWLQVQASIEESKSDGCERGEEPESSPDKEKLVQILSQALEVRSGWLPGEKIAIDVNNDMIWADFLTPAPGVWIVATPTSCSWLLIAALQMGSFGHHHVPVRGLIIRKGWLSSTTLDDILTDKRIDPKDIVIAQSLLTDVLAHLGRQRLTSIEAPAPLQIVAPLLCHPVTVSVRSGCSANLYGLRGKTLAVTHQQSNFLIRLCRAIEEHPPLRYRLSGRGPFDPEAINIEYVKHEDLFQLMVTGRIEAFATVEPYHYNFSEEHRDIFGGTFSLPPTRDLPRYCCVATIPGIHLQANPHLAKRAIESVQSAYKEFKQKELEHCRTVSELLSEFRAIPRPFGPADKSGGKILFYSKVKPIVTQDELAAEILESRRLFRDDPAFQNVSPTTDYNNLVVTPPSVEVPENRSR